jgi:hypothetical protein
MLKWKIVSCLSSVRGVQLEKSNELGVKIVKIFFPCAMPFVIFVEPRCIAALRKQTLNLLLQPSFLADGGGLGNGLGKGS